MVATKLVQLECAVEVEVFSGIVTSIELTAGYHAEAGMIENLPLVDYTYNKAMKNRTIFSHLYIQNELREEVHTYASLAQYLLLVTVAI